MKLSNRIGELVRACFSAIWIESHEHDDAIAEIAALCREQGWRLATWDIDQGLRLSGAAVEEDYGSDPLSAIRAVRSLAPDDAPLVVILRNFHRFLGFPSEVVVTRMGIAELLGEIGQHFFDHTRIARCGGLVIQVDRLLHGVLIDHTHP